MANENLTDLLYCRQFVLSPKKIDFFPLKSWKYTSIGDSFHVYSHPYLLTTQVQKGKIQLTLLGYIIDPNKPFKNNKEVLEDLVEGAVSVKDILVSQEVLSGRYIIIVSKNDETLLFNDACGLRQAYYYINRESQIWCSSQPNLLSELIELEPDDFIVENFAKKVFIKQKEYFWPGSLSEYSGLKKLLPNHFLDLNNGEVLRFFPRKPIVEISLQDGVSKASILLRKIMQSAIARFPIAMPLTAGFDSRTILSACKGFKEEIFYYTLLYPPNKLKSPDIVIPKRILAGLGLNHSIIDCTEPMKEWFADIYKKNVSYAHSYWGDIAFGMYGKYPEDKVCIKGNCSEVARCGYVRTNPDLRVYYEEKDYNKKENIIISLSNLFWDKSSIAVKVINEWLKDVKNIESDFNFHLLDLFLWEHDMGNWQAMSQLEWDIVQESFTPFNNRALLSILLSVNYKYRIEPDYKLYREIINNLWPELLKNPINPLTLKESTLNIVRRLLKKMRLYNFVKRLRLSKNCL